MSSITHIFIKHKPQPLPSIHDPLRLDSRVVIIGLFLLKVYVEAGVYGSETGLPWVVPTFRALLRLQKNLFLVSTPPLIPERKSSEGSGELTQTQQQPQSTPAHQHQHSLQ
jgi:hypothetical protein